MPMPTLICIVSYTRQHVNRFGIINTTVREDLSTGTGSGFLRKSTGANGRKRFSTKTHRKLVLFLQESPKVSGNLREIMGGCNLGILYSSSPFNT